ncbi:hypothetical protein QAD02_022127 [Eretmocerus hayati]|uniref:Uncharacterized protein n=1 Tax=Eretmocerus hayati TaxID=131215 RepID=A0ACC2PS71_9HYME|nr:hypothetical protein QAD02_022127 [Eretmocerus hayati]
MKREADTASSGPPSPNKRYRSNEEELRLLISSRVAGSVIGRGGQNIAKLRSQYNASITVPDCYGPERVLTIGAEMDTIIKILGEMVPKMEEPGKNDDNEIDLRMLVHQSQAGCIIGKGGCKIKELRELEFLDGMRPMGDRMSRANFEQVLPYLSLALLLSLRTHILGLDLNGPVCNEGAFGGDQAVPSIAYSRALNIGECPLIT